MTPFEAIYGRSPPSLKDYLTGTSPVATLDDLLSTRTHLLDQLKSKLLKAQLRIKNLVDKHRTDVEFKEGDWVFVKLQSYRQSTLAHRKSNKLACRFYGPFQILARVGSVAYRLDFPDTAKVINVFNVFITKEIVFGDTKVLVQWQNQPIIDATWENLLEFRQDFSSFNLEVKVSPDEGGNDIGPNTTLSDGGSKVISGSRKSTRLVKRPTRFDD
ncbi:hypothetical protein Tco_0503746 [Tanacetum coccineum]